MNIRVTPQELRDQSVQVEEDIKAIEKHWKAITDLVNGTKNYWEGEASITHIGIYQDVEEEVNAIIRRLAENPVKLQTMAGVYETTERTAEAAAAELPSDVF